MLFVEQNVSGQKHKPLVFLGNSSLPFSKSYPEQLKEQQELLH